MGYFIDNFVFSGSAMVFAMVFATCLLALPLYLLAPAPNRIVSSFFAICMWSFAIGLVIFGLTSFLDQLLSSFGLYERISYFHNNEMTDKFVWDMDLLRLEIITVLIGTKLIWIMKKYFKKTVFETEKDEKKSPTLFASQLFHAKLTGLLVIMGFVLAYVTGDFLLSLIPLEGNSGMKAKDFFINFLSILIPYALLFILLLPSLQQGKRFMPNIKSTTYNIFYVILMATVVFIGLFVMGSFANAILSSLIYNTELSKNIIRLGFIGLLVSGGSFAILWQRCGGKKAFLQTK